MPTTMNNIFLYYSPKYFSVSVAYCTQREGNLLVHNVRCSL